MAGAGWDRLTRRESAVLEAVGRRLTNAEIADEMVISVRTVESHIASLRRKLGLDSRTKLVEAARSLRSAPVPVPHNSFVGRDTDVAAVRSLLADRGWVTIVGAAGCGKTRMALELAAADPARAPVVVELEKASADEVVTALGKALGLGAADPAGMVAACAVALGTRPHLLVLDNCDHVTDAVAGLVRELLAQARSLRVLSTSQAPVGAADETVYPLAPLAVDDHSDAAARMFLDRAFAAAPTAGISEADLPLATRICRRLDGLPLAIELAAARARHLPLGELAARLDEGFHALEGSGTSSRHRTLEAAFAWTWGLLDDEERSVLSRLAALPRTFDLDLAEAVTAPGSGRVVYRLLDRSLVSRTAVPCDPVRFRLLDALRAFVLDRTGATVVDAVRLAHAEHHVALAERLASRARTDDSQAAAAEARRLCPEVNSAVGWTLAHERPDLALRLARALAVGGEQYGPDNDSLASIARAARDPGVREVATAHDLFLLGTMLAYGDLDLVDELAAHALSVAEGDASVLAARHLAGTADAYAHRSEAALEHLDVAERLADELLDLWQLASVRQTRGTALRGLRRPVEAMAAFESAMHTYALAGDAMHVNNARYMMAATAAESGLSTERAAAWAEECATYARASGNQHELAHALLTRASLSPRPDHELDEAVATFGAVGDLRCLTRCALLRAAHADGAAEVGFLEEALDYAGRAHDLEHQTTALERLARAHWAAGDRRAAALAVGALAHLVGYDAATARCPTDMLEALGEWDTAVAEGQARGPRPVGTMS